MNHTFKSVNCRGKLIEFNKPLVMGIVNITPDSFYENSRVDTPDNIIDRVSHMVNDGADIIDVGAYSSRPGAENINVEKEWDRLAPALASIRKAFPNVIISVDTFRSEVAKKAVKDFEVDIINDISAGSIDAQMFKTISELKTPYIVMHMQGTPQTMQHNPRYDHLMKDVFYYFAEKISKLQAYGIADIIIDPGFGFGKTLDHNYELLAKLDEFKIFNLPLLVGVSRKSMIYKYLNNTANEALNGTTALNTTALNSGANILRVHDVKEAVETVKLYNKLNEHK